MKISRILFISIFSFFLFSCEKETELAIPEPSNELVVNSILICDKPLEVYVGKSNFALDTNAVYLNNALVLISNQQTGAIDTLKYINKGIYRSENIMCKENTTYSIEVVTPDFEKAKALTQVPALTRFTEYSFNTDAGIGRDGFINKVLTISFNDNDAEAEYYMLLLEWFSLDSIPMQGYIHNNVWYSYSPIIIAEGRADENAFSDELFNGKQVSIPMYFHQWDYETYYELRFQLKCYLIKICADYYKYHKSYMLYQESKENIWQVNSPPQLYSNVENAFGIFSAICISDSIIINF